MGMKPLESVGGELRRTHFTPHQAEEMLGQSQDVGLPLAKRRHFDDQPVDAVEQVFPKGSGLDCIAQVGMGGTHDTHVDLLLRLAAEAPHPVRLEHAQQACLKCRRQLRDLVEKERAPVGLLEGPATPLYRTRERSALVPEQHALDELPGQATHVEHDERAGSTRASLVNRARHELLADTGFATQQHGPRKARDRVDLRQDPTHLCRRRDEPISPVAPPLDELEHRPTDPNARPDTKVRALHGHTIDPRTVGAGQIAQRNAQRVRFEAAVVSADGGVAEHDVIVRSRSDGEWLVEHGGRRDHGAAAPDELELDLRTDWARERRGRRFAAGNDGCLHSREPIATPKLDGLFERHWAPVAEARLLRKIVREHRAERGPNEQCPRGNLMTGDGDVASRTGPDLDWAIVQRAPRQGALAQAQHEKVSKRHADVSNVWSASCVPWNRP